MLLRELRDKGATIAWSPSAREPSTLAIGTKEGAGMGFDNYGGELQVRRASNADTRASRSCQLSLRGSAAACAE
jgi:hypothetical protein